jgi:hypothetical protein
MKDSFVIYTRYAKHIEKLNMEQRGVLFTAIMNHATGDELPEMDAATDIICGIIIEDIEECNRKWEETKAARSRAGKASAEKRQQDATESNKTEQAPTNSNKTEQTATNSTVNVNVNVNGLKEKDKKKKKAEDEFETLWELYPRKNGKKDAKKHYLTAVSQGTTFEDVKAGIEAYKNYIEKTNTEPKYIKMGSSFFHQRSWADDWSVPKTVPREIARDKPIEPPKYKVFEKEYYEKDDFKSEEMPDEIRNKLSGLFGS